ncbi:hypothetical protein BH20VER1_BH20VER1_24090 [soil metagenome]
MMLHFVRALAIAASLSFVALSAETVKVPNEEAPIATITIPEAWNSEPIDDGVAANSPDEAIFLAVVVVSSEKGMDAEIEDTFEMLKEHKVELDPASKKENKFEINGLAAEEMLFQGKDEDGPVAVSITFVTIKDKVVVLTYWVSTAEEKKHEAEVGKIVNSLRPAS